MSWMANLIRAEATKELKFKEPLPHSDPRCDIKAGQQALPSWQPDQPGPRLGGFEAAFVSQVLSRRGTGIYDLYCASFQSYEAYQRDKYHKEENPTVRCGHPWEPQSLEFTESCAKYCMPASLCGAQTLLSGNNGAVTDIS